MAGLFSQIKSGKKEIFRRAYIKRMTGSGAYESDWYEITKHIKKWGKISRAVDSSIIGRFKFNSLKLVVNNQEGLFNEETDTNSLWLGYASRQRTLVKLEAGFVDVQKRADGIWVRDEWQNSIWGSDYWDNANWDDTPIIFKGIISGNMLLTSSKNEIALNVMPLNEVFRQFPARNLSGLTGSQTASDIITLIRDQTDVNGAYIFRPFFENTTTGWDIDATTEIYANLNTSGAQDIREITVWEAIERLAQAENHVAYIALDGQFRFKSRAASSTAGFEFHGAGSFNRQYGHTIKKIDEFGPNFNKYYSRVEVKWVDADTLTSFEVVEATLTVSGASSSWVLGIRTFKIENSWIPTADVANTLATAIFNDYSALKREMRLATSFVPYLEVMDIVNVTYDSSGFKPNSNWDQRNWAPGSTELIWDDSGGDSLKLTNEEFAILSIDIDLDNLQCNFILRET